MIAGTVKRIECHSDGDQSVTKNHQRGCGIANPEHNNDPPKTKIIWPSLLRLKPKTPRSPMSRPTAKAAFCRPIKKESNPPKITLQGIISPPHERSPLIYLVDSVCLELLIWRYA
jgi:hypothetical protein